MSDQTTLERHIIVVGCGIGGVTAALALARSGVSVTVLERAPVIAEVGAGLQIGPNAGRVLAELDVLKYLTEGAVYPDRGVMKDIDTGEELVWLDFTEPFQDRYGAAYSVLHRGDLLNALLKACEETRRVRILPGKEVVSVTDNGTQVTATCVDSTSHTADGLIAADGLRSKVRRLLFDEEPPLASEYVIYRATVPRPDGFENAVTLLAGEHHHIMQYPIKGSTMVNIVCSFRSHRGEPGSDTWGRVEELQEKFAEVCPEASWAVTQLDTGNRWVQFDRNPMKGWSVGRITLTGDAAHAAHQYLAQGAGQAMEDAAALGRLASDPDVDLETAFQLFEEERFPRTSTVQNASRFWGELSHVGGEEANERNQLLSTIGPNDYSFIDWLYGIGGTELPNIPPPRDTYLPLESERILSASTQTKGGTA